MTALTLMALLAGFSASPGWTFSDVVAFEQVESASASAFQAFLDHLMGAESGGRRLATNPRSSAVGPFQFIKETFLATMRHHFPDEVAGRNDKEVLALRTNPALARRAAEAFSKDNAGYFQARGINPTFADLRLAFLLGPADAVRVLQRPAQTPVSEILSGAVMRANPFMRSMTAATLIEKCARDLTRESSSVVAQATAGVEAVPGVAGTRSNRRPSALHHHQRRLALSGAAHSRASGKRSHAGKAQRRRAV
jgi:hypothetical protein